MEVYGVFALHHANVVEIFDLIIFLSNRGKRDLTFFLDSASKLIINLTQS